MPRVALHSHVKRHRAAAPSSDTFEAANEESGAALNEVQQHPIRRTLAMLVPFLWGNVDAYKSELEVENVEARQLLASLPQSSYRERMQVSLEPYPSLTPLTIPRPCPP